MSVLSDHAEPSQAASCETFKGLCVIGLGDGGGGGCRGTETGTKKSVFKRKKINEHNSLGPFGWGVVLGHTGTLFLFPSYFSTSRGPFGQRLIDPCRPPLCKYSLCLPPPHSLRIPLI